MIIHTAASRFSNMHVPHSQSSCESSPGPMILRSGPTFESLLVPASEHRRFFLEPDLSGVAFQAALAELVAHAVVKINEGESGTNISAHIGHPYDVMQIMRGGLSFSVDRALFRFCGISPSVSFVSSQRTFDDEGAPAVDDLNYQKWAIQDQSILALADISATGTTIVAALDRAVAEYELESKQFRYLLAVVIGTGYTESALRSYNQALKSRWDGFKGTTLVYLDRVFSLNDKEDKALQGHKWGIDFFRKCAPGSMESELAVQACPELFLERCAIFDGGVWSRQQHVVGRSGATDGTGVGYAGGGSLVFVLFARRRRKLLRHNASIRSVSRPAKSWRGGKSQQGRGRRINSADATDVSFCDWTMTGPGRYK